MWILIDIPLIDASGIVIRLCEISIVDNGFGTVSSKLFRDWNGAEVRATDLSMRTYTSQLDTDRTIGRAECILNGLYPELRDRVHFADRVVWVVRNGLNRRVGVPSARYTHISTNVYRMFRKCFVKLFEYSLRMEQCHTRIRVCKNPFFNYRYQ